VRDPPHGLTFRAGNAERFGDSAGQPAGRLTGPAGHPVIGKVIA
jgi:hypothetical protein